MTIKTITGSSQSVEFYQLHHQLTIALNTWSATLNSSQRDDFYISEIKFIWHQIKTDRNKPKNIIHHSDRSVQYLSIRYTTSITDSGTIASVGRTGDSYYNALAETV